MMHLSHFSFQHVSPLFYCSVLSKDFQLLSTRRMIHMSKENMKRAGIRWDILGRVKTTEQGPRFKPCRSHERGMEPWKYLDVLCEWKKVCICTCVTGSVWSISENPGIRRNWSLKIELSHCYFTYLLVIGSGMWDWVSISSELWFKHLHFYQRRGQQTDSPKVSGIRAADGWKIDKVLCV